MSGPRLVGVSLILVACLGPARELAAQGESEAVVRLARPGTHRVEASPAPGVLTSIFFVVAPAALHALSRSCPPGLAVPVPAGEQVFNSRFCEAREQSTTWRGDGTQGSSIVLTAASDHVFARLETADGPLACRPVSASGLVRCDLRDPRFETPPGDDEVPAPAADSRVEPRWDPAPRPADTRPADDSGVRIDMMVLYTDGMAAAYPGSQVLTQVQHLIDLINSAFASSLVQSSVRLVHAAQVAYADDSAGGMNEALQDVTFNRSVFAGVEALRTTYGADQVTLLRRYVDEGCGLAWVPGGPTPQYAYSVVHDGQRPDRYYCAESTFAHEFGHNLGAAHDRANSSIAGRFPYSYGYQEPQGVFRTIMAYSGGCPSPCPRILYFSNPNVLYEGRPTGIADPDPNSADNARTFNQTRVEMAAFRTTVAAEVPLTRPTFAACLLLPLLRYRRLALATRSANVKQLLAKAA